MRCKGGCGIGIGRGVGIGLLLRPACVWDRVVAWWWCGGGSVAADVQEYTQQALKQMPYFSGLVLSRSAAQ